MLQDIRFGLRLLWKDRGFAATSILTLALCIGANAAIFAVVNSVLLQPLPVPHSEQLVHMYNAYPGAGVTGGSTGVPDSIYCAKHGLCGIGDSHRASPAGLANPNARLEAGTRRTRFLQAWLVEGSCHRGR